jgi:oligosaccharide repeat unit polymerase
MSTAIISVFWLAGVTAFFIKRHYLFAIALGIIGIYELAESIFSEIISLEVIQSEIPNYIARMDSPDINALGITLGRAVFFLFIIASYLFTIRWTQRSSHPVKYQNAPVHRFAFIILAVFAFGVISVYTGSGAKMIEFYSSGDVYGQGAYVPLFHYATYLLAVLVILGISSFERKHWVVMAMLVVAAIPIVREIIISGKRQFWIPSFFVLLLYLLYSRRLKINLMIWIPALLAVIILAMGVQFQLRMIEQGDEFGDDFHSVILWPFLEEFLGNGRISRDTWYMFVEGNHPVQYGLQWLFILTNSFPYLKFGNLLWPHYKSEIDAIYLSVAPWGGLPVFADAIIAFGIFGVGLVGSIMGSLLAIAHKKIEYWFAQEVHITGYSVYVISLVSTLILKYRSGIGDMLNIVIFFSCLFGFLYALGILLSCGQPLNRQSGRYSR